MPDRQALAAVLHELEGRGFGDLRVRLLWDGKVQLWDDRNAWIGTVRDAAERIQRVHRRNQSGHFWHVFGDCAKPYLCENLFADPGREEEDGDDE